MADKKLKTLTIKNVSPECHQRLKIYSAMTEQEQGEALNEALTIAISGKRKKLIDIYLDTGLKFDASPNASGKIPESWGE